MIEHRIGTERFHFFWRTNLPKPDGCGFFKWSIRLGHFTLARPYRLTAYWLICWKGKRYYPVGFGK